MLSALDPLGMPLATLVVAGNEADDGLYIPAITQTRKVVGQGGCFTIGDAKIGALATQAFVKACGDYYLMPLARTGEIPELMTTLMETLWNGEQPLEHIYTTAGEESDNGGTKARKKLMALGYEVTRSQKAASGSDDSPFHTLVPTAATHSGPYGPASLYL